MRKSRIEVHTNAVARNEARELARLVADDWHDQGPQPYDDDIDTDNELTSVNLAKFGLPGKTSLADVVRGVCKKWLLDDYMISNKIDLITSMITSLETGVANHLKESVVIRPCQVSELDQPDENNVKEISEETVQNWERMINEGGELPETSVDVANTGYEIDDNNPVGALEPIRGEILLGKGLLTPIEKAQIGDNPQACVLCDIIETRLFLNYLQRMVVEKTLHHAITVGGN